MHENARSALECGGLTPPSSSPGMTAHGARGQATVRENARSALECGGLTPPWSNPDGWRRPAEFGHVCASCKGAYIPPEGVGTYAPPRECSGVS